MSKTQKRLVTLLLVVALAAAIICAILIPNEIKLQNMQQTALSVLEQQEGNYDTQKIVLNNTTYDKANSLANKLNAKLRITNDGSFATLTLPENVTVQDIYSQKEYRQYLEEMSLDVYSRTSDLNERVPSAPQTTVSDTRFAEQSYIDYINMGTVWNSYKGNNITVAVIDTGIDTDHPEFAGRISVNSYNATQDRVVKDYNNDWSLIEDEQGHGTSVAGVIAAAMDGQGTVGIAPNVNLLIIKAECTPSGQFINTSDLVFGLYYAIEQDVDVVNMSFGGYGLNPYASATRLAVDSDIICVASAGNDGTTQLNYPAADENVIGVGALAENSWSLASYSNYGENVNIVAPGTTFTTKAGGGYGISTGTSLSSPIVAGAVALLKQQNKRSEFADVQELLYASSYDLGGLGEDFTFGYGALDVNALLIEQRGTVTFNMLTDELEDTTQKFIRNHTLQNLPEPERLYAIFDGWYYDIQCTEELNWYQDVFTSDLTLYANWVNEDDGVPYTYVTLPDDTIEIRSYTGRRRYITIPEIIDGKQVTSIGEFAFANQTRLREVTLPNGLNNIGRSAFENCVNLTNISIPQGVISLGEKAFYNNIRLHSIAFEQNSQLTKVGGSTFAYSGLTRIELPQYVNSVDGSAFFGATSLQAISVNKSNTSFMSEDGALFTKTGGTLVAYPAAKTGKYVLPVNTRVIGSYALGYTKASEIDLSFVQNIGANAFMYSYLTTIEIPDTVTVLGESAFAYNINLTEVLIGSGLGNISTKTFLGCNMLSNITIPSNIISIGGQAFGGTSSLTTINFGTNSLLNQIGEQAFYGSALREITIPNSVIAIGGGAFMGCGTLGSVIFDVNSSLQQIGANAFVGAPITSIDLPLNLRSIGDYAFQSTLLNTVTIPSSTTYVGEGAFAACHNLTTINVDENNTTYTSVDGVLYNADKSVIVEYPVGKTATTYNVLASVTTIGKAAFYAAWNLQRILLPSSLQTVDVKAFYDCKNIVDYTLPNTLENIEEYAFALNSSLYTLFIPDKVTHVARLAFAYDYNLYNISFTQNSQLPRIGYGAFAYTGLTSFRVPASVSSMAQYAFAGCDKLQTIVFAQNSQLTSVSAYMFDGCANLTTVTFEQGSSLKSIQAHGFEGLTKLQTVNFGNAQLTNIDNYAFRFDEKLQTLTIPGGVTDIGRYAFYGASSLTRLDLPESIEFIGCYAFYGAESLDIYFAAQILPSGLQENWDKGIRGYYVGVTDVQTNGDWTYAELKNGNVSLVKYLGSDTEINLNNVNLGGDIESIGGYCFNNSNITSVILPNTLTSIQAYAFARSQIAEITIPQNVTFIGQYAFFYTPLASVVIAANSQLAKIEQYAFAYTRSLEQISLPASLTTMGSYAFYESGIKQVVFADNSVISTIPQHAFASSKLQTITLPESVTLIDHNAFRDCTDLQNVMLPATNELHIMSNVFYNTSLAGVYIPANVTYIGEYAFVGLNNLNAFTVADNNANYSSNDGLLYNKNNSKLIAVPAGRTGSISLPQGIQTIGFGAFENASLSEVLFDENANILTFGYRAFYNAKNLTTITIPASVVSIDYYAFAECSNLQTIVFAEGTQLKGVYEGAFYGCKNLTNITLPDSIAEISDFAFYGCINMTQLPISDTSELKGIYSYAFAYTGITELMLPESVTEIGDYAFRGAKLRNAIIPSANAQELTIGIGAFADCNEMTEITVPFLGASFDDDDITWFGYIFGAGAYTVNNDYVPESLKTITIGEGITCLRPHSLYNLKNIERINVPHSVTMLYKNVFGNTTALYELTNTIELDSSTLYVSYFGIGLCGHLELSDKITVINDSFTGCIYLESITITKNVIKIYSPFRWCENLSKIYYTGTIEDWCKISFAGAGSGLPFEYGAALYIDNKVVTDITIPYIQGGSYSYAFYRNTALKSVVFAEGITTISSHILTYCENITSITIPNSVLSIGSLAFYGCSSLTDILIPDSVTSIGNSAFYGCGSLTYISIPNSVTIIGDYAFYNCDELTNITVSKSVTSIGSRAFYGCSNVAKVNYLGTVKSWCNIQGLDNLMAYGADDRKLVIDSEELNDELVIPDSVTSIPASAFAKTCISSVTIPNGAIDIGSYAFYGCNSLTSITVPGSVVSIGAGAFSDCSRLTSVTIGDNVTRIDTYTFSGCGKLTNLTIGGSVRSIDTDAFRYCNSLVNINYIGTIESWCKIQGHNNLLTRDSNLTLNGNPITELVIPDSIMTIPTYAFAFTNITSVIIPASVISIDKEAFYGCHSLTEITADESNPKYASCDGILYNKEKTEFVGIPKAITGAITIPDGIKTIDSYAFSSCHYFTSITIPDSVTSIGDSAFVACYSIIRVVNNSDLNLTLGSSDFGGVAQYAKLLIDKDGNKQYKQDGKTYLSTAEDYLFEIANDAYILVAYLGDEETVTLPTNINGYEYSIRNMRGARNVFIPNSVTRIDDSAFSGCNSLTSVVLPDGVTSIGHLSFSGCSRLTSIVIPDSVTTIGASAFSGCSNLTSVIIPNGVTTINAYTFSGCSKLSIMLPNSVTYIGNDAFVGVNSVKIPSDNQYFTERDGIIYNKEITRIVCITDSATEVTIPDTVNYFEREFKNSNITSVIIPNSISFISSEAFYGCSKLTSITIPNSVKSIGHNAFYNCSSLTDITISDCVTSIGYYAFYNCSSLTNIVIPSSVTSIDSSAFDGCSELTHITIPDSVTNIDMQAFYRCSNLSNINYLGTIESWCAIEGLRNLMEYGSFSKILSINGKPATEITLTNEVTSIPDYAFYRCNNLSTIIIENGVTSLGRCVFGGCNGLKSITIPGSLTKMEGDTYIASFQYCDNITSINYLGTIESWCSIDGLSGLMAYGQDVKKLLINGIELTELIIPNSVTAMPASAFAKTDITSVVFPTSIKAISSLSFDGCANLQSVTIPDNVTSIINIAFAGCNNLTTINYLGSLESWCKIDGLDNLMNCGASDTTLIIGGKEISGNLVIPDTVTTIPSGAFERTKITNVTIPKSVTSIGNSAFRLCNQLTNVEIPDSVTVIGSYAFSGCKKLEKVNVGNGVKRIESSAFSSSGIVNITIPESVEYMGDRVFSACTKLRSVDYLGTIDSWFEIEGLMNLMSGMFYSITFKIQGVAITELIIPETVTTIPSYAFYKCDNIISVTIPNSVTSIGRNAFSNIVKVINNSELNITLGSSDYGGVARNAKILIDKSGKHYISGSTTYLETDDNFLFETKDDKYTLVAYVGHEDTITLPLNIEGKEYDIKNMRGARNVIIPDGFTSIGYNMFRNCSSLSSVTIPDSVTSIGNNAFDGCSNLTSITIGNGVTKISSSAFTNTAYYNDNENWTNGSLIIGQYLIKVSKDAVYFDGASNILAVAEGAFSDCVRLKNLTVKGGNYLNLLSGVTNLETLVITSNPGTIDTYFGYSASSIPITLKNIVLKESVKNVSIWTFHNINNVNIYVERSKSDVLWDELYPNWNNGNNVFYGDEWIEAIFRNEASKIIADDYYLKSQVIRQPYIEFASDERYNYSLVGWDLDGDGIADYVPATSTKNINAQAVVAKTECTYAVTFYDKDGTTPLYVYYLPYDSVVDLPITPIKQGYDFVVWNGYADGMTVTGDIAIYSEWQHQGTGHVYADATWVDQTCDEQGYNKHVCTVCGEWYATDHVDKLGHKYITTTVVPTCTEQGYDLHACELCGCTYKDNYVGAKGHYFGEWIVDVDETCTETGIKHHVCYTCDYSEETITLAHGHNYVGNVIRQSTCTSHGTIKYICSYCKDSVTESLELQPHTYVKKVVSKSWLRLLVEKLLNIFFGYEGDNGYYFVCSTCGHIQTMEEASTYSMTASVQSVCEHVLGDWVNVELATCLQDGIQGRYCTKCEELVVAQAVDALGHDYGKIEIVDPTCTQKGYTSHICIHCGEYYATNWTNTTEHSSSDWIVDANATCTANGSKHKECTVCHTIMEIAEMAASGHAVGDWIIDSNATCSASGSRHKECSTCGTIISTETIAALGHKYATTVTAPTCTQQGYITHKCSKCGDNYNDTYVDATRHALSDWIVDKEATETTEGHRHKECTVCGETIVEDTIPVIVKSNEGLSMPITIGITASCSVATGALGCAIAWIVFKRKRVSV